LGVEGTIQRVGLGKHGMVLLLVDKDVDDLNLKPSDGRMEENE